MGKSRIDPLLIVFGVVAAAELVADAADLGPLRWITKPLLAPLLAAYLVRAGRRDPVAGALVFACAGDVALLFAGRTAFLIGILFFLGTQICLLVAFLRRHRPRWPVLVAAGLLWVAANALLWGRFGDLRVPLLVYSLSLFAMAAAATAQGRRITAGGLLFLVSDTLIALGRAGLRVPAHDLLVMSTYIAALALIVTGWAAAARVPVVNGPHAPPRSRRTTHPDRPSAPA
ncbi:lysoplasmalogenase [Actinoplanes sp. NPDC049265]|uniref:lysoplasmalogenase n=1 Tax=Actinoplanes sp. NPDC049265 TaxID=3363902 RepID=UPI0037231B47